MLRLVEDTLVSGRCISGLLHRTSCMSPNHFLQDLVDYQRKSFVDYQVIPYSMPFHVKEIFGNLGFWITGKIDVSFVQFFNNFMLFKLLWSFKLKLHKNLKSMKFSWTFLVLSFFRHTTDIWSARVMFGKNIVWTIFWSFHQK